ncbi:MAG: 2Fe-2S iron-sulfur cluster binding domain-containing protein [Planctomycetes bacterium]|nr:2Fe-2S iron-sulfur cluster binding domain-containing protein [Planctomycetota bacterium]
MNAGIRIRFEGHGEFDAAIGDSILDVALRNDVDLDHACGAVCACSTCHVKIDTGADALSEASEDEEDQLDTARGVTLASRLGCQARIERVPSDGVIAVSIPAWNVNLVQEGH